MAGPKPAGWKGGSESFTFMRQGTGPGHLAWNGYQQSDPLTQDDFRSALTQDDFMLGCSEDSY